ncbi:acetate/propionate family kinase [Mesomycoplasma ovipneumoniae]|uniref:Acetate kinase n=2 Tax=Mesomycoplasma ovipneumoniae TaxID=29562 RepID=A0AAP6CUA0_9BACT|nr:acetate/propionate family kinase [Mesomycoplasma ovipneumoniae]MDW2907380.1 acetate/propionate family kinase [Mesomycoplasma ovipneumoniae]MDW2913891.1 acetate/propionate family kinase [Mesomycoplasma ovipneumoniae]MDW2915992.1 acetate/propionate family kinase [Mesomycoplasma ovipneumoniae]MDW2916520.1 acetate/propionate family kinase [Mesomycoplasma ovipneumoniae]MDW2919582.1 acetate/propionate family kinase [Mesomycoplasma ovipneumoniae]
MKSKILVINAGSSSIKWQIFEKDTLDLLGVGLIERIGLQEGKIKMTFDEKSYNLSKDFPTHSDALESQIQLWKDNNLVQNLEEFELVGFRIVHGGASFNAPARLDDSAIAKIEEAAKFAPLHNPGALATISAIKKLLPWAKLSASFDTAFHASIPKVNYTYPINAQIANKYGIRKYGFHGISHKYITTQVEKIYNSDSVNFVNMHIGNGISLCAVKDSASVDTSMGMTPLAGVAMGTRSGDVDPSILTYLGTTAHFSFTDLDTLLNKQSGLLGLSNVSSDLRDVISAADNGNQDASFALEVYVQKIVDYLINYINKVGKNIKALVFTGGVGENSALIRASVIAKIQLPKLNLVLDQELNSRPIPEFGAIEKISAPESDLDIFVIKTNEELLIAKNALKVWN